MPKKKFEETAYDPFAAETARAAAVARGGGRGGEREVVPAEPTALRPVPKPTPVVAELPKPVSAAAPTAKAVRDGADSLPFGPTKRFKVTAEEDEAYEEFILRLRTAARSKVDFSVLSRVLWAVALHAEAPLVETLKRTRPPKRPSKNSPMAMAEYENAWVEALTVAFRRMGPAPAK